MKDSILQGIRRAADKALNAADKAKETTECNFDKVLDKTKDFLAHQKEVMRIEWDLLAVKNKLKDALMEYGVICYYGEKDDETAEEVYDKINDLEQQAGELKLKIDNLKAKNKEKEDVVSVEEKIVFCTKCGKEFKEDDVYCSGCGNKLNK